MAREGYADQYLVSYWLAISFPPNLLNALFLVPEHRFQAHEHLVANLRSMLKPYLTFTEFSVLSR